MKLFEKSIYSWYRQAIRHPQYRWWIILGTLAYFVFPFDLLPDIIPVVGQIDDVLLMTLLVSELSQVVLDRFKAGRDSGTQPENSASQHTAPASVDVDVEAVPVE